MRMAATAHGSFHLAASGLVLEHLADLLAFLRDARRVLRDGGRTVVSAMYPAMFLRNSQARFTDPTSGDIVSPSSVNHSLSEMVMATLRSGFRPVDLAEHAPNAEFAAQFPRAEKYVGWPMLILLVFSTE